MPVVRQPTIAEVVRRYGASICPIGCHQRAQRFGTQRATWHAVRASLRPGLEHSAIARPVAHTGPGELIDAR